MKRNMHSEFVGIAQMKTKHKVQLEEFERWAENGQWDKFHPAHYDWWMFPVNRKSSFEYKYTVYEGDIAELKEDVSYVRDYLRGVQLAAASWGWDLQAQDYLTAPQPGQQWQDWPIRLYKAAQSVQLFGFETEFQSLKRYALSLMEQGNSFVYGNKDLSWLFTTGIDPYAE